VGIALLAKPPAAVFGSAATEIRRHASARTAPQVGWQTQCFAGELSQPAAVRHNPGDAVLAPLCCCMSGPPCCEHGVGKTAMQMKGLHDMGCCCSRRRQHQRSTLLSRRSTAQPSIQRSAPPQQMQQRRCRVQRTTSAATAAQCCSSSGQQSSIRPCQPAACTLRNCRAELLPACSAWRG
jgi:hypothetical protein